ncbi:Alpha/Beta hydrolase protein [Kockovaella imperatae]|uniref:Alpha/Beta hydrolase protein n=1 Tax=Kockovaella imperatae TaxID=4999 RepID=A0A1Y1UGK0_9TREE|nr:Alpha/Beta hydrolase protein [Kockovaella imperatae]ORX36657.1 Alpha/Beta hydrolase protein [Kockovaella imperatae]
MTSAIPDDFSDHVFATKHSVPLWLRVYPAPSSSSTSKGPKPWLLWIHGGAYCSGQHYQLRNWILPLFHARGYHVVANAYRFMPYVDMEDMVQDCQDAFEWCRANLADLLKDKGEIDLDRCVVGGDSAGGGLATLLVHLIPRARRPRAVINVYGVVDLVIQQDKYDHEPEPTEKWAGDVSEEALQAFYTDQDPSHAVTATTNMWNLSFLPQDTVDKGREAIYAALKDLWRVSDEEWVNDERVQRQWDIKGYNGYKKEMVTLALRITGETSTEERVDKLKTYSSTYLMDKEESYPPTVMLSGTGDNAVPVEESKSLAEKLKKKGVEVLELYCPGQDHGWDNIYTKVGDQGWDEYIEPIGKFLDGRL